MIKPAGSVVAGLVLLFCASVAVFRILAQSQENSTVSATYMHGVLHVVVPYNAPRNGSGDLTVEVLDPEDRVVGGVDTPVYVRAGRGFREQNLALREALPVDDLVWHRLRYRFAYSDERNAAMEGIVSISKILRRPVVHVLDQQNYVSGGAAAVRLIVTETDNQTPVGPGSLRIECQGPGQSRKRCTQAA